ncbi:MAG: hypothetical protein JWM05_1970 [Acidimicrobiales bacterium]|nr:hypothetical protein [Acidimicrobiales bacterium]
MSTTAAAQLAFAAEFAVFLVSVAGLSCALRPDLLADRPAARSALAAGFLGLATVSFLHGSLIVGDARQPALAAVRIVSAVLVAVGGLRWRAGWRGRVLVAAGVLALLGGSVALIVGGGHPAFADACRLTGAIALGGAIVSAGRRSIPARIGINAAALLLGVVLAVSVAVSYTVSRNVQDEAARRYAARAANEADAMAQQAQATLVPAKLIAGELSGGRGRSLEALLGGASVRPATRAAARGTVTQALLDLTDDRLLAIRDPVLFVGAQGAPEAAVPRTLDNTTRLALAGDPVVDEARRAGAERQGIAVVRGRAYTVGAVPVFVRSTGRPERFGGLVVVARRLDDTYLRVLGTAGEPLSFALVGPTRVLASAGRLPAPAVLHRFATQVIDGAQRPRRVVGTQLVAAAPVAAVDQPPVMAFLVSVPTTTIDHTRAALFRNLFVVALGAALVALVLALVAGQRIGAGLRRLTRAAERLQGGSFDAVVDQDSDDELGVLAGAFSSMAGSIQTMTGDLRRAADDEGRLRARLEAVVAGMSEALVAVDARGAVIEYNRAAERLLGGRRADVLGRPVGEVVRLLGEDDEPVPADPAALPVRRPIEVDLVGPDGVPVPAVLTADALLGEDGRRHGAVLVLRDVRREREVEDMKTSFLANISHELRTPLTPIKGYAGMLRDREVDRERTQEFATEITASVEQLERVIGQLVTFASIAAGRLVIEPEPVDVAALAERAVGRCRSRVDVDRHRVLAEVVGSPPAILADGVHLERALDELLDNAVKYSPDGGDITVRVAAEDDGRVAISVIDHGVGMDADELSALTTAFAQGDSSTTRRFGGLGLGLAYVGRIVAAHGGDLRCASLRGGGTTVSMLVPVSPVLGPGETASGDVEVQG